MDALELVANFGTRIYVSSAGDTILSLARKIYLSDEDKYQEVLRRINQRMDWHNVKPGSDIKYIPSNAIKHYYGN